MFNTARLCVTRKKSISRLLLMNIFTMAPIVLYYFAVSAPCRVTLSIIKELGIEVEIRVVDLFNKEQLNADFLKINPQHTVPVLDDNGFILTESRAIGLYLVEKFFPNGHPLYPKDVKQRALINQSLQFDCGTLYTRIRGVTGPALYAGQTTIADENRQKLYEAIGFLNTFLDGKEYITGSEQPTLADLSIFSSITNVSLLGANLTKYPNIISWYERCKQLPSCSASLAGAHIFADKVKSIWQDKL